jgi:hypothetical protein
VVARAVSARDWLAPLAVLVPIAAMLVGAAWAFTVSPPLALLVVCGGLAATAAAGRRTYGARVSLVTAAITLPAAFAAFVLRVWIAVGTSLCGKDVSGGWTALACIAGALVFLALGSYWLRTYRPWTIVPLAVVTAAISIVLVIAAAAGTPGFCET